MFKKISLLFLSAILLVGGWVYYRLHNMNHTDQLVGVWELDAAAMVQEAERKSKEANIEGLLALQDLMENSDYVYRLIVRENDTLALKFGTEELAGKWRTRPELSTPKETFFEVENSEGKLFFVVWTLIDENHLKIRLSLREVDEIIYFKRAG
ncbi:MAG: hypothetical protein RH917_18650 [Lacipirellulaceae bacterium]